MVNECFKTPENLMVILPWGKTHWTRAANEAVHYLAAHKLTVADLLERSGRQVDLRRFISDAIAKDWARGVDPTTPVTLVAGAALETWWADCLVWQ